MNKKEAQKLTRIIQSDDAMTALEKIAKLVGESPYIPDNPIDPKSTYSKEMVLLLDEALNKIAIECDKILS